MEINLVPPPVPRPPGRDAASGEPPAQVFAFLWASMLALNGVAAETSAQTAGEAAPDNPLAATDVADEAPVDGALPDPVVFAQAMASAPEPWGSARVEPALAGPSANSDDELQPGRGGGEAVFPRVTSPDPDPEVTPSSPLSQRDVNPETQGGSMSLRLRVASERLWEFWVRNPAMPGERGIFGWEGESAPAQRDGRTTGEIPGQSALGLDGLMHRGVGGARTPGAERGSTAPSDTPAVDAPSLAQADAKLLIEQPRESSPARSVDASAQVAHAVRVCFARGGHQVTVHLEPESLGKIDVYLARESGGLEAHFRVEKPETFHALQAELPLLRHGLESRGVPLTLVFLEQDRGEHGPEPWARRWGRRGRRSRDETTEMGAAQDLGQPFRFSRSWGFDARI
jgi:hypothetical protein